MTSRSSANAGGRLLGPRQRQILRHTLDVAMSTRELARAADCQREVLRRSLRVLHDLGLVQPEGVQHAPSGRQEGLWMATELGCRCLQAGRLPGEGRPPRAPSTGAPPTRRDRRYDAARARQLRTAYCRAQDHGTDTLLPLELADARDYAAWQEWAVWPPVRS